VIPNVEVNERGNNNRNAETCFLRTKIGYRMMSHTRNEVVKGEMEITAGPNENGQKEIVTPANNARKTNSEPALSI
jgi:hypothetical protein